MAMGAQAETVRVMRFVPVAGEESEVALDSLQKVVFTRDSVVLISIKDGEPTPMYKYDYQAIVFTESSSPAGVEPIPSPSLKGWEKFIRDGQLFIRREGRIYTILGLKVKGRSELLQDAALQVIGE